MFQQIRLLIFLAVLCFGTGRGDKIVINSREDFNIVVRSSTEHPFDQDIELNVDLDLGSLLTQPLGMDRNFNCNRFSGIFDGKGHLIKNLFMQSEYSSFFCGLENATVKNVTFARSCSFIGHYSSSVSIYASGILTLQGVRNNAYVYGSDAGAGFLVEPDISTQLFFINCENGNEVFSEQMSCGFTCAKFKSQEVIVLNSINKAFVHSNVFSFGISPRVYFADNVVNSGFVHNYDMIDPQELTVFSFWADGGEWSSVFRLENNCFQFNNPCGELNSVRVFSKNKKGLFILNDKKGGLTKTLNDYSMSHNYGYLWTEDLDLEMIKS